MDFVLSWEGGYVNDPRDPGGETKYGISKRAHPDVDIKNLTIEQAKAIYREEYWNRINGDELTFPEALALMDFAVHSGVPTALSYWRQSEDVWQLQKFRREHLRSLKSFNDYGRGWMRRVDAVDAVLDKEVTPTDFELVQLFVGDQVYTFRPRAVSVGRTNNGRRKLMARLV